MAVIAALVLTATICRVNFEREKKKVASEGTVGGDNKSNNKRKKV